METCIAQIAHERPGLTASVNNEIVYGAYGRPGKTAKMILEMRGEKGGGREGSRLSALTTAEVLFFRAWRLKIFSRFPINQSFVVFLFCFFR